MMGEIRYITLKGSIRLARQIAKQLCPNVVEERDRVGDGANGSWVSFHEPDKCMADSVVDFWDGDIIEITPAHLTSKQKVILQSLLVEML